MLAIGTIAITWRGWKMQRTQTHLDWFRDQVAHLIGDLEADRDRIRSLGTRFEVELEDRELLTPELPFWGTKGRECEQLREMVSNMQRHVSTLEFISSGSLEANARSLHLSFMACSTALVGLWVLVIEPSPWNDDKKFGYVSAALGSQRPLRSKRVVDL